MLFEKISEMVHVDHSVDDASTGETIEYVVDQGAFLHLNERLGPVLGFRPHPRSEPGCEHHCARRHRWISQRAHGCDDLSASFAAPSPSADTDARWGKKGKKSTFGYKMHIGVDPDLYDGPAALWARRDTAVDSGHPFAEAGESVARVVRELAGDGEPIEGGELELRLPESEGRPGPSARLM